MGQSRSEIGDCYGSEWQLMRFLGHHREYLNGCIREAMGLAKDNAILWEDYPLDEKRKSQDGEWKGAYIPTLQARGDWDEIECKWKKFWPCNKNGSQQGQPSWDGVFACGEEIVVVEAKAYTKELHPKDEGSKAEGESREQIKKALAETKTYYGVDELKDWIGSEYYQLANRLAFVYFLNEKCAVKARLLNIYFLNGWDKAKDENERQKSVKTQGDWQAAIDAEYRTLGIDKENSNFKQYVSSVFVDCTGAV